MWFLVLNYNICNPLSVCIMKNEIIVKCSTSFIQLIFLLSLWYYVKYQCESAEKLLLKYLFSIFSMHSSYLSFSPFTRGKSHCPSWHIVIRNGICSFCICSTLDVSIVFSVFFSFTFFEHKHLKEILSFKRNSFLCCQISLSVGQKKDN